MRKFLLTYNSGSGRQVITCATKRDAEKVAREGAKLLGYAPGWKVEPLPAARAA